MHPYSEISRYPKEISQRHQWKANEWLNWLLYYSNPSLFQILPDVYFNHFQKLRKVIRILLGSDLNEEKLNKCNKVITKFVKDYEKHYGQKNMVYNVHLLLHLVESVRNFGPIWGFALFPYENLNGLLKSFVKGPKDPIIQINTKYLLYHDLNFNQYEDSCKPPIVQFCQQMIRSGASAPSFASCKFIQFYF